ncbi:MAG: 16S rRNA (cytosine967-C5)-methyltransferase [Candidatus Tokpelaia sp. JSC085]|nr:MAG: 16S rRNA (cytosine967-C5)-methyltransferase [Candidatus Tokpelaia sp. JSC085]
MRLGGRLQAVIDVLHDFERHKRPVSETLNDWGRSHRFAGSGDRYEIGNIVYDALRRRASISWRMESDAISDLAYGALLIHGRLDMQAIKRKLAEDNFAPRPLAEEKQILWQSRDLANALDHIRADIPQWCSCSLEKLLGSHWVEEGMALATRPPLDLRVNPLISTPERAIKALHVSGVTPVAWYAQALRISPVKEQRSHSNVRGEAAFRNGWVEVQDLGSQLASSLCRVEPGMQILDYCAGTGGKTMALAAAMKNSGKIHAFDAEKARLIPIVGRLHRAGVRNVQVHVNSSTLESLSGQMDVVVVDAPCTGTGVWRRRPDIKWRLNKIHLEKRIAEQYAILEKASTFVGPRGRLVYITCSVLFEENDCQVAHFLARHVDFRASDMRICWNRIVSRQGQAPLPYFSEHGILLSPRLTGTDGFFISVLKKR